jgi:hypothetical protein
MIQKGDFQSYFKYVSMPTSFNIVNTYNKESLDSDSQNNPPISTKQTATSLKYEFQKPTQKVENKYYHGYTKIIDILCVIYQHR